jgi:hypothetical protein
MRLFSVLAAATFLLTAAPALAQSQAPAQATPAVATAQANLEAASHAIEPVFAELSAQGATVRADAAMTPEQKVIRIGELIAARQPQIDQFIAAVQGMVFAQAAAEGATQEQAVAAAEMYRGLINQTLLQSMVSGEAPE